MSHETDFHPLTGIRITTLATNLPGPVAAARLRRLGGEVIKVEPPIGDPLSRLCPAWYESLVEGQKVLRLNLKDTGERAELDRLLAESDLLLTSNRRAALDRLSLEWAELHARYPRLSHVAIVGHSSPDEDKAGHDLTYQAESGLVVPPDLPRTLLADLIAAERVVSAALALLIARGRNHRGSYMEVALVEATKALADPWRYGATTPDGPLGGGFPGYNLYRARCGWVALAALEIHFWQRLQSELELSDPTREDLVRIFLTRDADEWEAWADARDLPLVAVRETIPASSHDSDVAFGCEKEALKRGVQTSQELDQE
ncbi:MAG: CoA transferase [Pyrinomonadaceae bacterium]